MEYDGKWRKHKETDGKIEIYIFYVVVAINRPRFVCYVWFYAFFLLLAAVVVVFFLILSAFGGLCCGSLLRVGKHFNSNTNVEEIGFFVLFHIEYICSTAFACGRIRVTCLCVCPQCLVCVCVCVLIGNTATDAVTTIACLTESSATVQPNRCT